MFSSPLSQNSPEQHDLVLVGELQHVVVDVVEAPVDEQCDGPGGGHVLHEDVLQPEQEQGRVEDALG